MKKKFGVKINGELINTIRYADDTAILCDDVQDLQNLIRFLVQWDRKWD